MCATVDDFELLSKHLELNGKILKVSLSLVVLHLAPVCVTWKQFSYDCVDNFLPFDKLLAIFYLINIFCSPKPDPILRHKLLNDHK